MKTSYKKINYISDEDIFNMEVSIYNDDNDSLYKAFPQTLDEHFKGEVFKKLTKGKRWGFIADTEYIITEDGLVFHSRYQRVIKIIFTGQRLHTTQRGVPYYLDEIFTEKGWDYDYHKIIRFYKDNGYEMYVNKRYRELFSSL